ncbi:MAG: DNA polymerase III subunit gamma/tau [Mycoplasma sp.]|nr:DNA polymerase III subunit gamma/tau [Mycoplasma sp.]
MLIMSYKSLYRVYRPNSFDKVVGQDHIVTTLKNVIIQNRINHAYLFAGPRGTGKTSIAYIFACLVNNIDTKDLSLAADIIEINAASNNGVAEIRAIIDNAQFSTSKYKYKVYIIDEVHMLTKGAWNAFLKTLEEPPKNVIFIMATTEPHKIPSTILSRVQRFNFKRIEQKEIVEKLEDILLKENIKFEKEAIKFLARLANGSLRDALSMADQVASYSINKITFANIAQVFGVISIDKQIELINFMFNGNVNQLISLTNSFINNGIDLEKLLYTLIEILRDYIVYLKTKNLELITFLEPYYLNLLKIKDSFAYSVIDDFLKLANDIKYSEISRHLFELNLLKISEKNYGQAQVLHIDLSDELLSKQEDLINKNAFVSHFDDSQINNQEEIQNQKIDFNNLEKQYAKLEEEQPLLHNLSFEQKEVELEIKDKTQENTVLFDKTQTLTLDELIDNEQDIELTSKKEDINFDFNELINLVFLHKREIKTNLQDKWNLFTTYFGDDDFGELATILESCKIIAASKEFALIKHKDPEIVKLINKNREQPKFLTLLEKIFKYAFWIYAINEKEYNQLKTSYQILIQNNQIPIKKSLEPLPKYEYKTKQEQLVMDIFKDVLEE